MNVQEEGKEKEMNGFSGFIFLCNAKTKPECYMYRVFGLPRGRIEIVEKIKPGMGLFLFDVESKLLYGPYSAASSGKLNLAPAAFGGKFPAQVSFQIYKDCFPLPESSFKHAIQDNYCGKGKFKQELNNQQVKDLLSLFRPLPMLALAPKSPSLPCATMPSAMSFSAIDSQCPTQASLSENNPYVDGMQHNQNRSLLNPQHDYYRSLVRIHGLANLQATTPPTVPYLGYPYDSRTNYSHAPQVAEIRPTNVTTPPTAPYLGHPYDSRTNYSHAPQVAEIRPTNFQATTPPTAPYLGYPYDSRTNYSHAIQVTEIRPTNVQATTTPTAPSLEYPNDFRAHYSHAPQVLETPHIGQSLIPLQPPAYGSMTGYVHQPVQYQTSPVPTTSYYSADVQQAHFQANSYNSYLPGGDLLPNNQYSGSVYEQHELSSQSSQEIAPQQGNALHNYSQYFPTTTHTVQNIPLKLQGTTPGQVLSNISYPPIRFTRAVFSCGFPCHVATSNLYVLQESSTVAVASISLIFFSPLKDSCLLRFFGFFLLIRTYNCYSESCFCWCAMGNCCSDEAGGRAAVGGTSSASAAAAGGAGGPNDAIDFLFKSRGFSGIHSQIELSFSATNLRDRDVLSKSDPMVVVYTKGRDGPPTEVFRSEVILNSLNPTWILKYSTTFQFEVVQTLVFCVYDVDTQFHNVDVKMLKLDEQQFLGEASCVLSEIVSKSNRSLTLNLVHKEDSTMLSHPLKYGQLVVHAEECVSSKTTMELILKCSDLEHKDLFSRINPFVIISKVVESGNPIPVCKTEVLKNDQNPIWKPIFLNVQQVGSKDSLLVIECYNFNSNGKHDLIGVVRKSLAQLEMLCSSKGGENLFLPTGGAHDHHNKVLKSQLFVDKFSESIQFTFLDYLKGGCELNFMAAIDFTASNGNPRLPDSLHYIDHSGRPNAYQQAIMEVGEVLQFYDSDKRFPAWGFGARPIDGPVSHCFNLNGSSNHCEVEGIQGIMMAYNSALFNVSLAGPTLFGPVINTAALFASQSLANGGKKYFVLLIITDGVVTDLQETKDAIVKASDLPLSILIVGVGGADFKEMEILDADKGERLESYTGRVASRDIVQFVPFRNVQSGQESVVQALLAELPTQFLTYMRSKSIQPNI
ncbi:protein BONZAI 1-like [Mercurialis annua]|uniref:protein BONZAI 1-like n=1 Tax=Mercurialis annua TaxID=3986 RepID=UPI0024AE7A22|nr:protein BONZAI 1-like [Mercurialis annua]